MGRDVIIACDFSSKRETLDFLEKFGELRPFVKIGMELYYSEGPEMVRELKARGHKVFVDLKVHDIPNTAASAMRVLGGLGADIVNVHAAGTKRMMEAAKAGLEEGYESFYEKEGKKADKPLLIAVTQLTSTSETQMQDFQNIQTSLQESVIHYAKKTAEAGLDGVVCSAKEVQLIKQATNPDFICLTPGIRPAGAAVGDQKRVMTPADAYQIGSDYIVVGRPITQAENPVVAYHAIKNEWTQDWN